MTTAFLVPTVLFLVPQATPELESVGDGRLDFLAGIWQVEAHAKSGPQAQQSLDAVLVIEPWTDGVVSGFQKRWYLTDELPTDFDDFTDAGLRALEPAHVGHWLWDRENAGWASVADWRPDYAERTVTFTQKGGGKKNSKRTLVAGPAISTDQFGRCEDTLTFQVSGIDAWTFQVDRVYDRGGHIELCRVRAERLDDRVESIGEPIHGGANATVTTLLAQAGDFGGSRALATDDAGTLYFAGAFAGETNAPLLALAPNGELRTLATGLAPAGLVWRDGYLYVHAHDVEEGRVVRIDTREAGGEVEHVGALPGDPLAVDDEGRIFTLVGEEVLRLVPGAEPEVWASSPLLNGGFALTADDANGCLIAGTWSGGEMYRVRKGAEPEYFGSFLGSSRGRCAWITMDGEDVLATSFGGSRVYRMDPKGHVTLVAGRGLVGDDDGTGHDARFHNPNGIALAPDGRTLYVAEIRPGPDGPFSRGRMRAIRLER